MFSNINTLRKYLLKDKKKSNILVACGKNWVAEMIAVRARHFIICPLKNFLNHENILSILKKKTVENVGNKRKYK